MDPAIATHQEGDQYSINKDYVELELDYILDEIKPGCEFHE